uniref:Putative reverse transcriptase domain-containing protein n=1 Tax=Tanacetum cinerariifolium TaxID=118510 RepID=A0A699H8T9_TANCI|nr:putative reverse transcriptase domain-containing protein [Tanacetum cinerariifolium]
MMIQSAGRETAAPQGERMGGRTGRGGGRTRGRSSDKGMNLLPTMVAQVGGQGSDQGNGRNQNGNAVNENIRGEVRNVIKNNDSRVCTYKEFLACNLKEYDGMSWEDFKTLTREEFCPSNEMQKLETELWNHAMVGAGHAVYTDRFHKLAGLVPHLVTSKNKRIERNGSIKKNHENRGNRGEPSKDRNGMEDNKRTRTGNAFATTTILLGEKTQGRGNNGNQARGKAFILGAEEARQDPRIVTGTFTLNNHYAINLFDSGTDYSFVSTTFIPLLGIHPSELGFSYEFEIASGQLVKIDKVIKGCKLEIEGHEFDINLLPFGSRNFDVIIGMDWLSNHKAEIICHEKVVRIPLLDGKVLRVLGERPKEKARHLMSVKAKEQKQEEMVVVRDFPEVFSDDLSGLPPIQEIEF